MESEPPSLKIGISEMESTGVIPSQSSCHEEVPNEVEDGLRSNDGDQLVASDHEKSLDVEDADRLLSEECGDLLSSSNIKLNGIVNPAADISDTIIPYDSTVSETTTEVVKRVESSSESEEESFLSLLFRRSTFRKSNKYRHSNKRIPKQQAVPNSSLIEHSGGGMSSNEGAGSRQQPSGFGDLTKNVRRSVRRLFLRNDSFYRAQESNNVLDSEELPPPVPPPRSDSISPVSSRALQNGASVTNGINPLSQEVPSNLFTTDPDSSVPVQGQQQDSSSGGSVIRLDGVRRNNETRRSVRFNVNRDGDNLPVARSSESAPSTVLDSSFTATESVLHNILRQVNQSATQSGSESSPENSGNRSSRTRSQQQPRSSYRDESPVFEETDEERRNRVGFWPHAPCSMLAAMSCTLSVSNICRFSFLSFQYGGGFILQFLMLSIVFGFPMVSFFMTLGQYMGCGIVDMWKVSPVFQGVGVASLIATALIGIYTIIPISWMFVYFRDSFVTNGIFFKWAQCSPTTRHDYYCHNNRNFTFRYRNTVPEYFHTLVLQRSKMHPVAGSFGDLKFQNVFNLAVVWLLVFICLSKGLKSYGKVVFAFAIFPLVGFLVFSIELLRQAEGGTEHIMNMNTHMYDVFVSGASWLAAAREAFFTWGIHGAVIMQITAHNPFKNNIKRDSTCVILVTLSTLLLSSFLACSCFSIVYGAERSKIMFYASSFENERSIQFIAPNPEPLTSLRNYWSNNFLLGEEMMNFNDLQFGQRSNYQVFRLVTELFPTAMAYLNASRISPFWSVLLYLTFITFGLAQQLAIWRCVIEGVIAVKPRVLRAWETTITFATCVMGFVFGLPLATELGIFVVYFLDFCVGSAWWIMIIYLVQILAIFIVRGKPYSADQLVSLIANDNFSKKWLSNVTAFSWNVITPMGLLVLSIVSFRSGMFSRMFNWYDSTGYPFWPTWVRQVGTIIQLIPLMIIPVMGLIQTCRYMAKGPEDLFDRLQLLYRPIMRTPPDGEQSADLDILGVRSRDGLENNIPDDPPPKYTPPPSYSTATGLRLIKRLNSIRRSFRSFGSREATTSNAADVEAATASPRTLDPAFFFPMEDRPSTSRSLSSQAS